MWLLRGLGLGSEGLCGVMGFVFGVGSKAFYEVTEFK